MLALSEHFVCVVIADMKAQSVKLEVWLGLYF